MRNFLKQTIKWQRARRCARTEKRGFARVYLSGAVTDIYQPEHLFDAGFRYVLLTFGSETRVINPLHLCSKGWSWLRCMAKCLWHLRTCDVIVMLSNWKYSKGAKIERKVAFYLGLRVMYAPVVTLYSKMPVGAANVAPVAPVATTLPIAEQDNDITGYPV